MKTWLVTGGTGSFGQAFVRHLLASTPDTIRVLSRDEQKQDRMKREVADDRVRYLLGDVRDADRIRRAVRGVDYVVHAAALKIIPAGEYNPDEVCKTNVMGSHNVIEASIDAGVERLVCISSDKAVAPVNLYGATKLCMEKMAVLANAYSGPTRISCVRYGNVIGSRGSILTILREQAATGFIRITHQDMTRFWITLPDAAKFVERAVATMFGGEVFIPKLRSTLVEELCRHLYPTTPIQYIGLRPGEKMHEWMTCEYEVLEDCGWAYNVTDAWVAGMKPYSSEDVVVPASELLSAGTFAEEVACAAA